MSLIIAGLDLETTGLLTDDHRIIEVYIGLWRDGTKVFEFEQRINPERQIAVDATRVHGITNADVIASPTFKDVAPKIVAILSRARVFVAHNGEDFDGPFLAQELKRVGASLPKRPMFDTMKQGVWATPTGKMPNLGELCFACGVPYDPSLAHAAAYDVEKMMDCLHRGIDWGFYDMSPFQPAQSAA